jgi:SAM-dependent methyltransferase
MISNFKFKSKKIKIINIDLRKLRLKNKFDLVLSMFHVINYMVKNKDINAFFNTASRHLNSGGVLIFDTWYYPAVKYNPPKKTKKTFIDKKFKMTKVAIPTRIDERTFDIKYLVNIINIKNLRKFNFMENHRIRAFNIKELDKVTRKYNFKKIANYSFLKRGYSNCFAVIFLNFFEISLNIKELFSSVSLTTYSAKLSSFSFYVFILFVI